ncbi:TIGR03617 family F420-dependent LLM class oxidoreductase [Streptomyces sp. TLI_171]|uniref:TIGR03617 family F420-dependent LLM class oxidoreductase n=1 Tax=Streptomyces sp. TLI_171 TaxID=1938859 RepID=UPI000C1852D7|nr:TIGR03617 family F420-dependent LLM class oxidoreductase [Streptomyces sp. TLI_171]RKE17607.1 putative F420-dependent oxidoreductase [Streptomyces sp. TLI_171]
MRIDLAAPPRPATAPDLARAAEERGADRFVLSETSHNPFLQLARAADRTRRIELGTGVAIAFARTPMALAYEAWGLHESSGGRAAIGLGTQIKPHVVRRYGMPWDRPAARMRDYVAAVRAIWHSWQTGERLAFRGEFYAHTLMTPVFAPDPQPYPPPPILLAAVGPLMTATAGAVADGFLAHPFGSPDHLATAVLPTVRAARAAAEAEHAPWTTRPFEVVANVLVATGHDEDSYRTNLRLVRERLAFYASTPAYRPVLETHGWAALQDELHPLSLRGRWQEMGALIDDTVLNTFAVTGEPAAAARELRHRYGGTADRLCLSGPDEADPAPLLDVLAALTG